MTQAPPLILDRAGVQGRLGPTSLTIQAKQCFVVAGPNGAGKSTLLRVLAGLVPPTEGQVLLGQKPLQKLRRQQLASHIAWLPQRPAIGDTLTTEQLVAMARYRFGESDQGAEEHARQLLCSVGASQLVGRLTSQISGGELQRVLIATLVAQQAPYLLVDEPANHLDPHHQVATYQRLGRLWSCEQRTVVIATHDIRLTRLLGQQSQVRLLGVKDQQIVLDTCLTDPALAQHLEELYEVPFVATGEPGELAVDLSRVPGRTKP